MTGTEGPCGRVNKAASVLVAGSQSRGFQLVERETSVDCRIARSQENRAAVLLSFRLLPSTCTEKSRCYFYFHSLPLRIKVTEK